VSWWHHHDTSGCQEISVPRCRRLHLKATTRPSSGCSSMGPTSNPPGERYGTAPLAASDHGHDQVVQRPLEHGPDVKARGGYFDTALQACRARQDRGHIDTGARREIPFSSVQSLYVVELKSSLRRRLARYTYARRMLPHSVEKSIARRPFGSADRPSCPWPVFRSYFSLSLIPILTQ